MDGSGQAIEKTRGRGRFVSARARTLLIIAVLVHATFLASLVLPGHFLNPLFPEGVHTIATVYENGEAVGAIDGAGLGADFFAFYQAGRYVLNGDDIYRRPMDDPDRVVPYGYFYRYLPFVAYTLGVAANAVSPWTAYWIWALIVESLLAWCIVLTRRAVRDDWLFAMLAAMWLMYTPFYMEQYMGQLSFVMGAMIFAMVIAHARGQVRRFDWLWIATVIIKHMTILFVPIMVRLRRYRTVALAFVLLALTAVPYLIFRNSGVGDFTHDNFDLTLYPYSGNLGALALVMVLKERLFPMASQIGFQLGPVRMTITRMLVLGTMALPTLAALWATFRRRPFDLIESVSLWTMVYFFVFREIWEYHFVLLMPLFVLLYAKTRARVLWWIYALAAAPTLFVLYDVPGARSPEVQWTTLEHIANHAFKIVPLVWLFVWVAWGFYRRHVTRVERGAASDLAIVL
jgi:alpha-1,2-mannosyltransferase